MTHWDRLSADDRLFVEVEVPLNKMHIAGCFVVDVGSFAVLRLRATSEWSRVTACEKQSSPLAADSGVPVASEEQRLRLGLVEFTGLPTRTASNLVPGFKHMPIRYRLAPSA